jgi:hypothetical protein
VTVIWGLDLGADTGGKAVRSLRGLRNVIRAIADKYAARRKVPDDDWDSLNAYLDRVPVIRQVAVS